MISLHYKETNLHCFNLLVLFTLLLQKSSGKMKLGEFKSGPKYFAK